MFISFICNCQNLEVTKMFFNRWMDKLWYIHTMKYYSAMKRNELSQGDTTSYSLGELRQKGRKQQCWWGCGEIRTPVHCWRDRKITQQLGGKGWHVLRTLKRRMAQPFHSWLSAQENGKLTLRPFMHRFLSLRYSPPSKVETTQCLPARWMGKQNKLSTYKATWVSLKKE